MNARSMKLCGATVLAFLAIAGPAWASFDTSWLSAHPVTAGRVTEALNSLAAMSPDNAAEAARTLRDAGSPDSPPARHAAALLQAAALEAAGKPQDARGLYVALAKAAENSPYGTTASCRIQALDAGASKEDLVGVYEALAKTPEATGWFLGNRRWTQSTTRRHALESLVQLREDYLSWKFFQYIRSLSPLPLSYAYVLILLVLTLGTRVLTLPFQVWSAKTSLAIEDLAPRVAEIRSLYSDDALEMNRQLSQLYESHGVKLGHACLLGVLDLAFVIWVLVVMSGYSAQMLLDGARLLWVSDVTRFSFSAVALWVAVSLTAALLGRNPLVVSAGQVVGIHVVMFLIIAPIAWFWSWPAYVFVFWLLLGIVGDITRRIIVAVCRAVG